MVAKRGKKHAFIWMDVEFVDKECIKITMDKYINECVVVYGEDKLKMRQTPGAHDPFALDKSPSLDKQSSDIFHHIVAKLLFVVKWARLEIDSTVSFLCTRESKNAQQNWLELGI